jgi:hypothetical protein
MKRTTFSLFAGLAIGVAGCAPSSAVELSESTEDETDALTSAEAQGILYVVNSATVQALDVDAELDSRAAKNIVAHRLGPDAEAGTADDNPFGDIAELDAVPQVGASALEKLRVYALEVAPKSSCLVISEYVEGMGNYNKAIELYNCGLEPLDLSRVGVCLVRNADTSCTVTRKLAATTLEPGEVFGVCRAKTNTTNDPHPYITAHCDQELPGVMLFDGDDRLVVFEDLDEDGTFYAEHDRVLDGFGVIGSRPPGPYWADKVLRRCNLTPFNGLEETEFLPWEHFTSHARTALEHYGFAPEGGGCP